jgi:hypothetical protein
VRKNKIKEEPHHKSPGRNIEKKGFYHLDTDFSWELRAVSSSGSKKEI